MSIAEAIVPVSEPQKPLLRGVSHQVAMVVALVAATVLTYRASPGVARVAAATFGAAMVLQLGVSALYHRVNWSEGPRRWMRRLDHSAIFVLIAGGYTPLFATVPSQSGGHLALVGMWLGAAIGVVKSLAWPHAPKWVTAGLCVGVGWVGSVEVMARIPVVGWGPIVWVVASGVVYSLGALVYALKRPNPSPRVFGYHEVFHALVIIASVLLFTHVVLVLEIAARSAALR